MHRTIKFYTNFYRKNLSYSVPNSLFDLKNKFSVQITHAEFIKNCDNINHILNLYTKSKHLSEAQNLFDEIPHRDVQTWTTMISGLTQNGFPEMGIDLFSQMLEQNCVPNQFTFSSVFKCCSSLNELRTGRAIHACVLRRGIVLDVVLSNSVLDMYVKCGVFGYAEELFRSMVEKNTVSWNIMIGSRIQVGEMDGAMDLFGKVPLWDTATWNTIIDGHIRNGSERVALDLLYEMVKTGPLLDKTTFSIALVLASKFSMLALGKEIHGKVLRSEKNKDGFIGNSLIDLYCNCGRMDEASSVFESFTHRNVDKSIVGSVSSSSMIKGYFENGKLRDALDLLNSIIREGNEIDLFTLTTVVSMSGNAGLLEFGQQIQARTIKHGQNFDIGLTSSMIDMYARCGKLDDAWLIFSVTTNRNVVLWTSMISTCASHGQGKRAIELFELMLIDGIRPNEITFITVLTACSHSGLLKEGCEYFTLMREVYGIKPLIEHFACMVDLFGRSGRLDMAKEFIYANELYEMSAVWKAFLSSCRLHKDFEMAKWVSEKLLALEPLEPEPYVLLSNASAANCRWNEVANVRALMKERKIRQNPGQSWIQI